MSTSRNSDMLKMFEHLWDLNAKQFNIINEKLDTMQKNIEN